MYSLQSYTEQVYNIGSPKPSPRRSPFLELPVNKDTSEFDFSPVPETDPKVSPIKISVTTRKPPKRKYERADSDPIVETENSPKRAKMLTKKDKEDFITMIAEQSRLSAESITNSLRQTFESRMDNLQSQIQDISTDTKGEITNLGTQLKEIKDNTEASLANIHEEFGQLRDMVTETASNNLEELKDTLVPMVKDDVVERVKSEMKADLSAVDAIWKASLADKVWEAEHNLLIFNYDVSKAPMEDAKDFLEKELKANAETMGKIYLKRALRLGKGRNGKPPPLLLKFSHPSDRGLIFSLSKNLKGKPFKIEKDVPKLYKKTHADFKEEGWKLREHFDYQTQISFNGHLMVLQFRNKSTDSDKFHYINHMEWFPPPSEALSLQKNTLTVPQGTIATPVINPAAKTKAECSFFMSGMKTELTSDDLKTKFNAFLKPEHKALVTDIKLKKKDLAIIYCDTWDSCKTVASSYSEFNGEKVSFKMFAAEKPKVRIA